MRPRRRPTLPEQSQAPILVVNRGEIAERAQAVCRRLGLAHVLFCTPSDRSTLAAEKAEQLWMTSESESTASYLNLSVIEKALRETKARALYPGYGFLSESAELAALCERLNVIFIGPSLTALRKLAHKEGARELATQCQIPTLALMPPLTDKDFPVLLKAAHGGGGRGHALVEKAADFKAAEENLRQRSKLLFQSEALLIERYLPKARHVELQIFVLPDGGTVFLGTRDCTVQRNFQKIIEEAPMNSEAEKRIKTFQPALSQFLRSSGYQGPGTLEFLYDPSSQNIFFLEMNCRIQVEHTVTEEIIGCDLVEAQITSALGLPMPTFSTDNEGHALQVRLYAEAPSQQYRPSPGSLALVELPHLPFVRFDMTYGTGHEVSSHYDPLLGKMIVRGQDRSECLDRALQALKDVTIHGVLTNIEQLKAILANSEFRKNLHTTASLPFWMKQQSEPQRPVIAEAMIRNLDRILTSPETASKAKGWLWKRANRK